MLVWKLSLPSQAAVHPHSIFFRIWVAICKLTGLIVDVFRHREIAQEWRNAADNSRLKSPEAPFFRSNALCVGARTRRVQAPLAARQPCTSNRCISSAGSNNVTGSPGASVRRPRISATSSLASVRCTRVYEASPSRSTNSTTPVVPKPPRSWRKVRWPHADGKARAGPERSGRPHKSRDRAASDPRLALYAFDLRRKKVMASEPTKRAKYRSAAK